MTHLKLKSFPLTKVSPSSTLSPGFVLSTHPGGSPWLPTHPFLPSLSSFKAHSSLNPTDSVSCLSFLPSLFYGLYSKLRPYHVMLLNRINTSLLLPSLGALQDGIPNSSNL
uniref:Uncharacterized protein n=1 Tax=Mus musculus TaxID=10090 RepID=Q3UVU5_MOUSE|nr:unnamed protein product [Mus musculus]